MAEGGEAHKELLRVGHVGRVGLIQFGHGVGKRLLCVDTEGGVQGNRLGERMEASP